MTQDQLLGLIATIALLTAPSAIIAYLLIRQLWLWLRWRLPPRHLVSRGWREVHAREGKAQAEVPDD